MTETPGNPGGTPAPHARFRVSWWLAAPVVLVIAVFAVLFYQTQVENRQAKETSAAAQQETLSTEVVGLRQDLEKQIAGVKEDLNKRMGAVEASEKQTAQSNAQEHGSLRVIALSALVIAILAALLAYVSVLSVKRGFEAQVKALKAEMDALKGSWK